MPWSKTFQLVATSAVAYGLGLYTMKFAGGGWDWTNVVGFLGCITVFLVNLILMIRDFWKSKD
jgi:hypothetical protein